MTQRKSGATATAIAAVKAQAGKWRLAMGAFLIIVYVVFIAALLFALRHGERMAHAGNQFHGEDDSSVDFVEDPV